MSVHGAYLCVFASFQPFDERAWIVCRCRQTNKQEVRLVDPTGTLPGLLRGPGCFRGCARNHHPHRRRAVAEVPHEAAPYGDQAERILSAGLEFAPRMLETAMQPHEPRLLDQQLDWAYERLPHDGVVPEHILSRFQIYAEVVGALLPAPHAEGSIRSSTE